MADLYDAAKHTSLAFSPGIVGATGGAWLLPFLGHVVVMLLIV
jgi:hypothetical protein